LACSDRQQLPPLGGEGPIVSGPIIAGRIHEYKFGRPALVILAVREGG